MAKDKATGEVVAIKKIRSLNEVQGVSLQTLCQLFSGTWELSLTTSFCVIGGKLPVTTIREIKVLKCLNHPNLVELKEVVVSSENDDDDGEFGGGTEVTGGGAMH